MNNPNCPRYFRQISGFTLVEIMFVILIIGILLVIAIPNFVKVREQARRKQCVANLRKIEWAKDAFLMDKNKSQSTVMTTTDLYPSDGSGYLKFEPKCNAGGVYFIGDGFQDPTCDYGNGHVVTGN